ncbi:putative oxidoreductase [Catenovulum agarivorans DS-2]|uniref:Putative oxidoreductase n=1 Tax=Catenovulum agarivorans DS-2 TaxID=1328313 RepID=W7QHS7_9ALTE|nr:zinc-binding dehydrogenase [Catenovulum agarivorans]EWH11431.1 putative oxidoreductase [Catenovulum agarivorans DS-2]
MQNIPKFMKAIALESANENFKLVEIEQPVPQPTSSELLVKLEYVGLNPVDAKLAKKGFPDWQYPHILGLDAVGTVVKAPVGASPSVGERVMWHADLSGQGVLSEYTTIANYAATAVPDDIAPQDAATLPCAGLTAIFALDKIQIKQGDLFFVDGGAGAVGQYAIQLAKKRGAIVYASASKKNHALLQKLGAEMVFDYQQKNFIQHVQQQIEQSQFDAVLDTVGGDNTARNIEMMRFCGRIACLNGLPPLDNQMLFRKAPNISIVFLGGAWLTKSLCAQQCMSMSGKSLIEEVQQGHLKPLEVIPVEFNAAAITLALHDQLAFKQVGKRVVEIG